MALAHEQATHRWITEGPGTIKRIIASHTAHMIQAFKKYTFQYHCNIKANISVIFFNPKTFLAIAPEAEAIALAETNGEKKKNRCKRADQSGKVEWGWGL